MFFISEAHPFLDVNGRIERVIMNGVLVAACQSKIIIPTVFREDYMGAIRNSRNKRNVTPIKMLQRAHEFSANVYNKYMDDMQDYLT